jgi:hypothetical protein
MRACRLFSDYIQAVVEKRPPFFSVLNKLEMRQIAERDGLRVP